MLRQSRRCETIGETDCGINSVSVEELLRIIETIDQIDEQLVPNSDNQAKQKHTHKRVNKCLSSDFERNTEQQTNKRLKQQTDNNCNDKSVCDSNTRVQTRIATKLVFAVVWGKHKPYRKHKEWTGDGFVVINDNDKSILFYDIAGKSMGRSRVIKSFNDYTDGKRLVIDDKEIELINEVSLKEFESKSLFVKETDQ